MVVWSSIVLDAGGHWGGGGQGAGRTGLSLWGQVGWCAALSRATGRSAIKQHDKGVGGGGGMVLEERRGGGERGVWPDPPFLLNVLNRINLFWG